MSTASLSLRGRSSDVVGSSSNVVGSSSNVVGQTVFRTQVPNLTRCFKIPCGDPNLRNGRELVQLASGIIGHLECITGPRPALLAGMRHKLTLADASPSLAERTVSYVKAHPFKVAAGVAACALLGFAGYKAVQASAVAFHTYCLEDKAGELWCTTKAVTADAANAVFKKFRQVDVWVPSQSVATRTLQDLKGGAEHVLDVTKKLFQVNPFARFFK